MVEQTPQFPNARSYEGPDVTVLYDRGRCVHFAECVRGLPAVFDVTQKPWIQPSNADANEIADTIERCPSGALHYLMTERTESPQTPTELQVTSRGQILLRGDLQLTDESTGEVVRDSRISLCGCGASGRRPYCDTNCYNER